MDLERLKLFTQVAEFGSLTKAAVMLDTFQPALSRQISALEKECGGRLFNRTGRGVTLTELGERILPRVIGLLNDADQLSNDIKQVARIPIGEVRLGLLPSMAQPLVNLLYRKARDKFPGIRLHILEGSSGQIDEWLATGRIDIGILFRYGDESTAGEQTLAVVDSYLVGPVNDSVTRPETVTFSQLNGLPLVLPGMPNGLRVILDQLGKQKKIDLSIAMEADSIPIQKYFVIAGSGYTILAFHAVVQEVKAGLVQASRIISPAIDRTITLGTTVHKPLSLASREIDKLLRQVVDDLSTSVAWKRRRA